MGAPTCSTYSNYTANLAFDEEGAVATVTSSTNPLNIWGEFADGTYSNNTCSGAAGAAIPGFTGVLTQLNGTVCSLGAGTYRRGLGTYDRANDVYPELNVKFTFTSNARTAGSGSCPSTITLKTTIVNQRLDPAVGFGPFVFEYASVCNGVIAPQGCALGHQKGTW